MSKVKKVTGEKETVTKTARDPKTGAKKLVKTNPKKRED